MAALQDNLTPHHGAASSADTSHGRQTFVVHVGIAGDRDIRQSNATLPEALLDASQIAARLGCSLPTSDKILARGDIPSTVTTDGRRVATAAAVDAWIAQRDRQRVTLAELASEAQLTVEGRRTSAAARGANSPAGRAGARIGKSRCAVDGGA